MLQYIFVFAAELWTGKHLFKGISLQKSELLWHLTLQFKNKQLRSQDKSYSWAEMLRAGALCPAAPMLKSRGSCQTLTCQLCLVCHNCTTTSRRDLQGPKYWIVRYLLQTAGVHAQQAANSPNRNKGVGHQHSDADEKKIGFTQYKTPLWQAL